MGLCGKKDEEADEEETQVQFEGASKGYELPEENGERAKGGCCGTPNPHTKMEPMETMDVKRRPTDVIWFIAIVVMWVATTVVGAMEASNANPQALLHPADYQGQLCGIDSSVINKPYGYYINKAMDMVCLDKCPSKTASIDLEQNAYENMICKSDEISDSYKNADIDSSKYYDYDGLFADGNGNCNYEIETYAVLYYCVFDLDATLPNITSDEITFDDDGDDDADFFSGNYKISKLLGIDPDSSSGYMMEFIQDLYTCRAKYLDLD